jgi:hypothetical protein
MEDKGEDAFMAAANGSDGRFAQSVPVDAHSVPCYPISLFKPSFRVRVKRTPIGQPRRLCAALRARVRKRGLPARDLAAMTRMQEWKGVRRRKRL